jgi:hypothetical protein
MRIGRLSAWIAGMHGDGDAEVGATLHTTRGKTHMAPFWYSQRWMWMFRVWMEWLEGMRVVGGE